MAKLLSAYNATKGTEMNIVNAIIYARYSTDRQDETSIIDQLRRCREFAVAHALTVSQEFIDEGISGAAFGNRPGVQKALATVSNGDVLLVMDTTRLSRSQDLAPLITRLRYRGVRVIGVTDKFDSDSPTARMHAGLSGIMSEEFRAQIAARTHSALDMRAREGKATGGKCYGYSNTGEVIEAEAAVVREVFKRAAAGESQKAIAADLNVRGIPAPGAKWSRKLRRCDGLWLTSAIHSMLANQRYAGKRVWNTATWVRDPDTGRRTRRERPQSEWIASQCPAIIDGTTWDLVRALASPRKLHGGKAGGGPKYLLSGILVCGECGQRLIATGAKGAWYYCGTHRHGGDAACTMRVGARRDVAEEMLLKPVEQDMLSPKAVELAVELMDRWHREERVGTTQTTEIAEIDARIARIEAQVTAGILEPQDIAPSLSALQERRRVALAASKRQAGRGRGLDAQTAASAYREAVAQIRDVLAGPVAAARSALHEILGDVVCRPEGKHLVAIVQLNPVPLWRAAGLAWIGSGGRI